MVAKVEEYLTVATGLSHPQFLQLFTPEFNDVHARLRRIRLDVLNKMRKLSAGGQPFSLEGQVYQDTIRFWGWIVNLKVWVYTSRNHSRQLAKRLGLEKAAPKSLTLEQANRKLSQAYSSYYKIQQSLPSKRFEFQRGLIEADKDKPIKLIPAQIKRERHQQICGKNQTK